MWHCETLQFEGRPTSGHSLWAVITRPIMHHSLQTQQFRNPREFLLIYCWQRAWCHAPCQRLSKQVCVCDCLAELPKTQYFRTKKEQKMLITCQIDWRKVGVAFEMQCFRNCTLSSFNFQMLSPIELYMCRWWVIQKWCVLFWAVRLFSRWCPVQISCASSCQQTLSFVKSWRWLVCASFFSAHLHLQCLFTVISDCSTELQSYWENYRACKL